MSAQGKKVAFLLTKGVEQVELTGPRKALDDAGAQTFIVSPSDKTLQAMQGDWDHADIFDVDVPLSEAKAEDFDLLVLPGGTVNADTLRTEPGAMELATDFFTANKPVAAICHAPWLLAQADLIKGRSLTSVDTIKVDLVNAGATWKDEQVVIDGNLITSRTPDDIEAFNAAVVAALD